MTLPRSTPSAQGVDATGLIAFLDTAQAQDLGLHSLMVARHGHVVAEGWWSPYAADRLQLVYSLSKTLTATAVGVLAQEGRLSLDDLVLDFFPEIGRSSAHPLWGQVRIRHCLSMTVGHETDAWDQVFVDHPDAGTPGADWVPWVFATAPSAQPGTVFAYNQIATYLLSVIVGRVAGAGVRDVLRPGILDPLGVGEIGWHTDTLGRELGFTGAHVTTEAVLSLAQLYLDRGVWQGRRLLTEGWVDEATVAFGPVNRDPASDPDWRRGYGYSFWMQRYGYRGDGAYGQYLMVLPDHDVAIAITSEQPRMQDTLDALWEHVVPAVGRVGQPGSDAELEARLASLYIEPLVGPALGPDHAEFSRSGLSDLSPLYGAVSVTRDATQHVLGLVRDGERLTVRVGSGEWAASSMVAEGWQLPVVASGGWVTEDTFRAEVRVIETPHTFHVEAHLRSGDADLTWRLMPLMGPDPLGLVMRAHVPSASP